MRSMSGASGASSVHCLSMLIPSGGNTAAIWGVTLPCNRSTSRRAASRPRSRWSTCGLVP